MRLKATVSTHPLYRKAIIFSADPMSVYLFVYTTADDTPCAADYWFASISDAQEWAYDELAIQPADWRSIPDPQPGQQHDREG